MVAFVPLIIRLSVLVAVVAVAKVGPTVDAIVTRYAVAKLTKDARARTEEEKLAAEQELELLTLLGPVTADTLSRLKLLLRTQATMKVVEATQLSYSASLAERSMVAENPATDRACVAYQTLLKAQVQIQQGLVDALLADPLFKDAATRYEGCDFKAYFGRVVANYDWRTDASSRSNLVKFVKEMDAPDVAAATLAATVQFQAMKSRRTVEV